MFWYFSKMAPTGYSITVDVDMTGLRGALKERGFRFFPAYLWLVTKCLNEQTEFKVAQLDAQGDSARFDTPDQTLRAAQPYRNRRRRSLEQGQVCGELNVQRDVEVLHDALLAGNENPDRKRH